MRSSRSRIVMGLGLAAAAAALAPASADAGISVDPSSTFTATASGMVPGTTATDAVAAFPYSATTTAADPLAGTSAVRLDASDALFLTNFTASVNSPFSYASGAVSLVFTPASDLSYALSGSHTETGLAGFHSFSAALTDTTLGVDLFDNGQQSSGVTDETLTLGNQAGTGENFLSGSFTGTLTAGHTYALDLSAETDGFPNFAFAPAGLFKPEVLSPFGSGPSANGSVTLSLAPVTTSIPLPPAAWTGLGMLATVGAWLKLRRRSSAIA